MNILITGATGYIGGKLVQRLLDKEGDNASIFVLVRGDSIPWDDQRICVVKGDLKDLS